MEPMGSEQSQQQSPRKSDLAFPTKTMERDVASKQGEESIASHASPTIDDVCMSSSPSTSSGASPASGGGSSHHSPASSLGTSTTGGARRDTQGKLLDNPQMHGKSKKYSSIGRLKLASQVGVDSSGEIRKDFPFEKISSRSKLKELTHNTLFSTVLPKKRKVDDWVAEQTSSESLTTVMLRRQRKART